MNMGSNSTKVYEFPGVGFLPLEPPSDDLKPFFRRKYRTFFRNMKMANAGVITREELQKQAEIMTEMLPQDERKRRLDYWMNEAFKNTPLFGRERLPGDGPDNHNCNMQWAIATCCSKAVLLFYCYRPQTKFGASITEDQFVKENIKKAFADPSKRAEWIKQYQPLLKASFDTVDVSQNGVIDYEEWQAMWKLNGAIDTSKAKMDFEAIHADRDGVISLIEFQYAWMSFMMCSGPESLLSYYFGCLVD